MKCHASSTKPCCMFRKEQMRRTRKEASIIHQGLGGRVTYFFRKSCWFKNIIAATRRYHFTPQGGYYQKKQEVLRCGEIETLCDFEQFLDSRNPLFLPFSLYLISPSPRLTVVPSRDIHARAPYLPCCFADFPRTPALLASHGLHHFVL